MTTTIETGYDNDAEDSDNDTDEEEVVFRQLIDSAIDDCDYPLFDNIFAFEVLEIIFGEIKLLNTDEAHKTFEKFGRECYLTWRTYRYPHKYSTLEKRSIFMSVTEWAEVYEFASKFVRNDEIDSVVAQLVMKHPNRKFWKSPAAGYLT